MIDSLTIKSFKTLKETSLDLGQVNVFIGANGSGKSNVLEALGVLAAAAAGKVDQPSLIWRGCRGSGFFLPMFEDARSLSEIHLTATAKGVSYSVGLTPPPGGRLIPWNFRSECLTSGTERLVDRTSQTNGHSLDSESGLAALKLAEISPDQPASVVLKALSNYSIFAAATPILHGWARDPQEREPVGLGGGRLAEAIQELVKNEDGMASLMDEFHSSVEWFSSFGVTEESDGHSTNKGLAFQDRFFRKDNGHWFFLGPNDVNEGALYLAFLAVLGLHPHSPRLFAIENVDHGLNPLLAKRLMAALTSRILNAPANRQILLTTHNPLVLDGLPLGDDRVRLFTVDRDNKGWSIIRRFLVTDRHREMASQGWTLSRMWINKLIGGVPDV